MLTKTPSERLVKKERPKAYLTRGAVGFVIYDASRMTPSRHHARLCACQNTPEGAWQDAARRLIRRKAKEERECATSLSK